MTRTPVSESSCPYCGVVLAKSPTRKQRCPACKQIMYVRLGLKNICYTVTEDEARKIKRERRLGKINSRAKAYPLAVFIIVTIFVLIGLTNITSGWLWFLGIVLAITLLIIMGNYWDDFSCTNLCCIENNYFKLSKTF